ncbi:MAG: zf-TFIIB domain-containing protein [Limisphaerales bacterium]
MKCPACFNSLTQLQVGSLVVDVCQDGCGGVWFDAFEFQRVDEESESAGEALLHIRCDPKVVVDPARKRDCPRCAGMKLQRHFFSALRRVEIDECPNCAGYWLDAGELAQIRAERAETARRQEAKLSALSGDTIRYLYRLRSEQRKGRV